MYDFHIKNQYANYFSYFSILSINMLGGNQKYYQPLISTLDRSQVRQSQQIGRTSMLNRPMAQSRISTNMRSLSPQEAQVIRRETHIPNDKELVATNQLWKIRGKQFTAVDVQVKEGRPIPAEYLLHKSRQKPVIEETLYEFKSKYHSPQFGISSTKAQSPIISNTTSRRVASPVRISKVPTYNNNNNTISNITFPIREPIPLQMSNKQSRRTQQGDDYGLKSPYRQPIPLLNKGKETRDQRYKYNLFSSLDELVNSGCGSCGSNQIIAKRPNNQSWK